MAPRWNGMASKPTNDNAPPEPVSPVQNPREQTDKPNHKQTDEPWKGNPEKEQLDPDKHEVDLEKWQETNTH
jgi:hypothetical protein